MMFSRILVPLDGSTIAEKALDYAKYLALKESAAIHLVRVSTTELVVSSLGGYPVPQSLVETQLRIHKNYLARVQADLEGQGLTVSSHALQGDPAAGILALAQREKMDLIVMSSHGRSGLSRFFIGSVAERIARHACCPVLIVGQESLKASEENSVQ